MQMLEEVQAAVTSFTGATADKQTNTVDISENSENKSPFCEKSNSSSIMITNTSENVSQVFKSVETYVKQSVRFCKRFTAFSALQQIDQMIILKDAFPAIFAVYHAFAYVREQDGFPLATVNIYF